MNNLLILFIYYVFIEAFFTCYRQIKFWKIIDDYQTKITNLTQENIKLKTLLELNKK